MMFPTPTPQKIVLLLLILIFMKQNCIKKVFVILVKHYLECTSLSNNVRSQQIAADVIF